MTHISREVTDIAPSRANLYSSGTVVFETVVSAEVASIKHGSPYTIDLRITQSVGHRIGMYFCSPFTAARLAISITQATAGNGLLSPAFAATRPLGSIGFVNSTERNPPAKSVASRNTHSQKYKVVSY